MVVQLFMSQIERSIWRFLAVLIPNAWAFYLAYGSWIMLTAIFSSAAFLCALKEDWYPFAVAFSWIALAMGCGFFVVFGGMH